MRGRRPSRVLGSTSLPRGGALRDAQGHSPCRDEMLFDDEPGDDPRLRSSACLRRSLLLSLSAEFASKHCSRKIPGGLCSIDTSGMGDGRSGPRSRATFPIREARCVRFGPIHPAHDIPDLAVSLRATNLHSLQRSARSHRVTNSQRDSHETHHRFSCFVFAFILPAIAQTSPLLR